MSETVSKAEFDALKAKLDKLEGLHLKTEQEKIAEKQRDEALAKKVSMRAKAREVQGKDVRTLKYIVGPSGAYVGGQHFRPGQIVEVLNDDDSKHLPAREWEIQGANAPKAQPEKRGPMTAAEMNKADAERPKHGVQAQKKGHRPSDTEV